MGDLISIGLTLIFGLTAVVLIARAIWAGLVAIFGDHEGTRTGGTGAKRCPCCEQRLLESSLRCGYCGWYAGATVAQHNVAALNGLRRRVSALADRGLIDAESLAEVLGVIERRHEVWKQRITPAATRPELSLAPRPPVLAELVETPAGEEAVVSSRIEELDPHSLSDADQHVATDVGERARQYASRVEAARAVGDESGGDVAAAASTARPRAARKPRRNWTEILAAFMEQRHIRWGELVGGLLIVCCSIALVISFWAQIAERPFLKFFVFNGVTAALFAAGFYTQRKWKLESTSQGLLIIATLLVPLNFLAIAAFSIGTEPLSVVTLGGEAFSFAIFAWLLYCAGRTLLNSAAGLFTVGVLLPSVLSLAIRRHVTPDVGEWLVLMLAGALTGVYAAVNGWMVRRVRTASECGEAEANSLFKLLGVTTFAAALPLGLLVSKTEAVVQSLHELSPFAALLAFPSLAVGLLVWSRITGRELGGVRTAGLALVSLGALGLLGGIGLAWPDPVRLVPLCLVSFAALTAVAVLHSIPAAQGGAAAALAFAVLLVELLSAGHIDWQMDGDGLLASLLAAPTAVWLAPVSAMLAAGGIGWAKLRRSADAVAYGLTGGLVAALSIALATYHGFGSVGDESGAVWIYAGYALAALAAAAVLKLEAAAWTGAVLLNAAIVQGTVFTFAPQLELQHPWFTAFLAQGVLLTLAAAVAAKTGVVYRRLLGEPFARLAVVATIAATAILCRLAPSEAPWFTALGSTLLAGLWLLLAAVLRWPAAFAAAQVSLVAGVVFGTAAWLDTRDWFPTGDARWLDPWSLQAQGIALAILALAWLGLRAWANRSLKDTPAAERRTMLLTPCGARLENILATACLVLLMLLAVYAAAPGAAQELSPRAADGTQVVPAAEQFEFQGLPHEHAMECGSWLLLALVAAVLLATLRQQFRLWKALAVLLCLAAAAPLLAARFEESVAVASALRWLSAGYLLLGSTLVWNRRALATRLRQAGLLDEDVGRGSSGKFRTGVIGLALTPLVIMGLYVAVAAVLRSPPDEPLVIGLWVCIGLAVLLAAIAAGLRSSSLAHSNTLANVARHGSLLLMVLSVAPLLATSLYVVAAALRQQPILGPTPGTFFDSIGPAASYALPVLVIALVLVGYAIRERDSGFGLAAGLVLCIAATAGYLLLMAGRGAALDAEQWIRLAQLNAAVSSLYALGWMLFVAGAKQRRPGRSALLRDSLLLTQLGLGTALQAMLVAAATAQLLFEPTSLTLLHAFGSAAGWASAAATALAGWWWLQRQSRPMSAYELSAVLATVGTLLACTLSHYDAGDWLAFHAELVALVAGGGVMAAFHRQQVAAALTAQKFVKSNPALNCAILFAIGALAFAMRGLDGDPQAPWWSLGGVAAVAGLAVAIAIGSGLRGWLVCAAVLVNVTATIAWAHSGTNAPLGEWLAGQFVNLNLLALAVPAPLWLLIELRVMRDRGRPNAGRTSLAGVVASLALAGLATITLMRLTANLEFGVASSTGAWDWAALLAVAAAMFACLWDARLRFTLAGLYLTGLVGAGLLLQSLELTPSWLMWLGMMLLAAYTLATSLLWCARGNLAAAARWLRMPVAADGAGRELNWLVPLNCLVAAAVIALAIATQFHFEQIELRFLASQAVVAQAVAIALLARGALRTQLQYGSLSVGVIGAILLGWSGLDPATSGTPLNYLVVALAALVAMSVVYGLGLTKLIRRDNQWTAAAQRLAPVLVALGAVTIGAVLAVEAAYYLHDGKAPIDLAAVITVAVSLGAIVFAALAAALAPGRDPLRLSERGRMAYVYAAEIVLGLLFIHLRLTMPWLFRGVFQQFWPLIVVAIAFAGVGLSELFRRQNRTVLAEPLERTGAFLPLFPVLGYWMLPSQTHFSLVMTAIGGLYLALSVLRRSFVFGILAAIAANAGLWYFLLHTDSLGLLQHPQLWFIPPALCVLLASYLNREQLSEAQLTSIRYATATIIYVSSTADIFLNGVATAPWLPLVLGGLSILGILAGILLRVRGFLFLGTSFLLMSLLTIIWYAAVDLDQTWVWSVSGIVTGVLLIAMFAVFEKKRQDILRVLEQLKGWKA